MNMSVQIPEQADDGKFLVKRSELHPIWQSAPKQLIIDDTHMLFLASGYRQYPKSQYGGRIRFEQRLKSAFSAPVVVVDDIPIPPEPIEPREFIVGDKWDARYKHPIPMLRSKLPPHWQDARTSLIRLWMQSFQLAFSFEQFPAKDISWESRMAYAYQTPIEIFDDVWGGKSNAYDEYYDSLTKKELRLHHKWSFEKIGTLLQDAREQSETLWKELN
jgi:hypothetical protein